MKLSKYNKVLFTIYGLGGIIMAFVWYWLGHKNNFEGDYSTNIIVAEIASALLAPVFISLPFIIKKLFKYEFPQLILSLAFTHIFFAHFIGSVCNTYDRNSKYDDLMHTLFGAVGALCFLYVFTSLEDYTKFKSRTITIFTFFMTMALGALWEIYEFGADKILGLDMQRTQDYADTAPDFIYPYATGDTMHDLWVTFIGASVVAILLYLHKRNPEKNYIAGHFINKRKQLELQEEVNNEI